MILHEFLLDMVYFLIATLVLVPFFKFLKLSSMLGYIVAGILIGPFGLKFINGTESLVELGEIGITLLLFVVGLELSPIRLKALKSNIINLGGSQVTVSAFIFGCISYYLGVDLTGSIVIGLALSLSSTAFALSYLSSRSQLTASHGNISLSILLFQDIIIVPILAVIPMLQLGGSSLESLDVTSMALKTAGVGAIILFCIYPLKHVIALIKSTQDREIMLASFLFFIISMSMGMEKLGLSMSLGAFMAGVFLANSEVKNDLFRTITPFKGVLMGLFFMTLGVDMDFSYINSNILSVTSVVMGIFAIKGVILFSIASFKSYSKLSSLKVALLLCQTGEFGIVILERAGSFNILTVQVTQILSTSILISMVSSPIIMRLTELSIQFYENTKSASAEVQENVIPFPQKEDPQSVEKIKDAS